MDALPEKPNLVGQTDETATPGPSVATVINPEGPRITDPTVAKYMQSHSATVPITPELANMGVQPLGEAILHPTPEIAQTPVPAVGKHKLTDREKWLKPFLKQAA